jgi:hypothetical protein
MVGHIIANAGLDRACIHTSSKTARTLPGFYRPSKEWDLLVVADGQLVAAIEVKSQVGSLGNNFNNRVEEALVTRRIFGKLTPRGCIQFRADHGSDIFSC